MAFSVRFLFLYCIQYIFRSGRLIWRREMRALYPGKYDSSDNVLLHRPWIGKKSVDSKNYPYNILSRFEVLKCVIFFKPPLPYSVLLPWYDLLNWGISPYLCRPSGTPKMCLPFINHILKVSRSITWNLFLGNNVVCTLINKYNLLIIQKHTSGFSSVEIMSYYWNIN